MLDCLNSEILHINRTQQIKDPNIDKDTSHQACHPFKEAI